MRVRWPFGAAAGAGRGPRGTGRTSGEPKSANGASSFHLRWLMDGDEPLSEVSAVLEVVDPPAVDRLYFWALQVSFAGAGGAHIGLQWNRSHPGGRAVNWGGYGAGGRVLTGSTSPLPSRPDDPNTRDYAWEPHRPYRLRVHAAPGAPGSWRGEVTDLATGQATVVRDLHGGGDHLAHPLVWSEVFARCDHPSVTVRWSGLEATGPDGAGRRPRGLAVSYEPGGAGGCDNTTSTVDQAGNLLQTTNTERVVPAGAVLPPPPAPPPFWST